MAAEEPKWAKGVSANARGDTWTMSFQIRGKRHPLTLQGCTQGEAAVGYDLAGFWSHKAKGNDPFRCSSYNFPIAFYPPALLAQLLCGVLPDWAALSAFLSRLAAAGVLRQLVPFEGARQRYRVVNADSWHLQSDQELRINVRGIHFFRGSWVCVPLEEVESFGAAGRFLQLTYVPPHSRAGTRAVAHTLRCCDAGAAHGELQTASAQRRQAGLHVPRDLGRHIILPQGALATDAAECAAEQHSEGGGPTAAAASDAALEDEPSREELELFVQFADLARSLSPSEAGTPTSPAVPGSPASPIAMGAGSGSAVPIDGTTSSGKVGPPSASQAVQQEEVQQEQPSLLQLQQPQEMQQAAGAGAQQHGSSGPHIAAAGAEGAGTATGGAAEATAAALEPAAAPTAAGMRSPAAGLPARAAGAGAGAAGAGLSAEAACQSTSVGGTSSSSGTGSGRLGGAGAGDAATAAPGAREARSRGGKRPPASTRDAQQVGAPASKRQRSPSSSAAQQLPAASLEQQQAQPAQQQQQCTVMQQLGGLRMVPLCGMRPVGPTTISPAMLAFLRLQQEAALKQAAAAVAGPGSAGGAAPGLHPLLVLPVAPVVPVALPPSMQKQAVAAMQAHAARLHAAAAAAAAAHAKPGSSAGGSSLQGAVGWGQSVPHRMMMMMMMPHMMAAAAAQQQRQILLVLGQQQQPQPQQLVQK